MKQVIVYLTTAGKLISWFVLGLGVMLFEMAKTAHNIGKTRCIPSIKAIFSEHTAAINATKLNDTDEHSNI